MLKKKLLCSLTIIPSSHGALPGRFLLACMMSRSVTSWLFETLWTIAYQSPLSMGFFRQWYWSGLPFPPPGEFSQPRDRNCVSCIAGRFFTQWATGEAPISFRYLSNLKPCYIVNSLPLHTGVAILNFIIWFYNGNIFNFEYKWLQNDKRILVPYFRTYVSDIIFRIRRYTLRRLSSYMRKTFLM